MEFLLIDGAAIFSMRSFTESREVETDPRRLAESLKPDFSPMIHRFTDANHSIDSMTVLLEKE